MRRATLRNSIPSEISLLTLSTKESRALCLHDPLNHTLFATSARLALTPVNEMFVLIAALFVGRAAIGAVHERGTLIVDRGVEHLVRVVGDRVPRTFRNITAFATRVDL